MTKSELIEKLEEFDDDCQILVLFYNLELYKPVDIKRASKKKVHLIVDFLRMDYTLEAKYKKGGGAK